MATAIAGVSLLTPRVLPKASSDSPNFQSIRSPWLKQRRNRSAQFGSGRLVVRPVAVKPDLSDKVAETIKDAEKACAGDPVSGECAALWDEVEELSAAVSHLKDKEKDSDPLEEYCKDNPETDECRTYED